MKLDALPFQRHWALSGTLRVISENSFQPDKGEARTDRTEGRSASFGARIALNCPNLRDVSEDFPLIAGMTTTAEVTVGARRVISYLSYPIIKELDES